MSQVVNTGVSQHTPAPHFVGDAIGEKLKELLDPLQWDSNPDLTFRVKGQKGSYPLRRLLKSKCQVHSDGTIVLVVRMRGACSCPHSEEKFYFQPQFCGSVMKLAGAKQISELIVGYPDFSSTFELKLVS